MINGYTKSEIRMLYRDAKDKDKQIVILCQLTGLRKFEIEMILEEGGYLVAKKNLELREKIIELHAQGLTIAEIAKEVNTVYSNAYRYLKELNLEPNVKEDKKVSNEKVEPIKEAVPAVNTLEKLKEETKKNFEELKEILPKSIPEADDPRDDYEVLPEVTEENAGEWKTGESIDMIETLTPTQYYELAKLTFEILKGIWGC